MKPHQEEFLGRFGPEELADEGHIDKKKFARGVSERAGISQHLQDKILEHGRYVAVTRLARNPSISHETQKNILKKDDEYYSGSLAMNPNIHPEVAHEIFEKDPKSQAVASLAINQSIPSELYGKIVTHGADTTRMMMVGNPKTPLDVLETLKKDRSQKIAQAAELFHRERLKNS